MTNRRTTPDTPHPAGRRYHPVKKIAEWQAVAEKTVWKWIRAGVLQASRNPSGQWRIREDDYFRFEQANRFTPVESAA